MVTEQESAAVSEGRGRGLREDRVNRRGPGTETGSRGVRKVSVACNFDSIR